METAPPSYEAATLTNVWQLVAPYLSSSQLCRASLVSKEWHRIFSAQLWGMPTSHFGLEFNGVLDHLARFQKTLDFARHSTRSSTYCLHLTPSQAIYFDDRPADWLKTLLELLPSLQALLVPGVSYFDHAACQALQSAASRAISAGKAGRALVNDSFHGLRLLDASKCQNLTSSSLANALGHLTSLVYLDLSYSHAAKDRTVYRSLELLYALKVLKLRSIRLTDDEIPFLANAIGQRVCSLDVRDNSLNDSSVDVLIDACFQQGSVSGAQNQHLDSQIYRAYATSSVNRLTIEDVAERGITALQISGNKLNEVSLSKLMSQSSLQSLDIGSLIRVAVPQLMLNRGMTSSLRSLRVGFEVVRTTAAGLYLRPELLSSVHTLVLTNFPEMSATQDAASHLIDMIKECAHEAFNALSLARSDYDAPPGRQGAATTIQRTASRIFALQTIVLGLTAPQGPEDTAASLTGDKDSEAMWSAGASDFSFFREDEEMDKAPKLSDYTFTKPKVDNLALLSAFRKDRRLAHEHAVRHGQGEAEIPGYWPGTIRIQRNPQ